MYINDVTSNLIKNQKIKSTLTNNASPTKNHVNPFEDPALNITGKSSKELQKTIPVDDKVAEKLRNLIKEDFIKRKGMCGNGSQADKQANIIKNYVSTLPSDQKLAAIYSCEQIAFEEADRLSAKIKEQNPTWQYGQVFDVSILNNDFNKKI